MTAQGSPRAPLPLPPKQMAKRKRQELLHKVKILFSFLSQLFITVVIVGLASLQLFLWIVPMPKIWFSKSTLSLEIQDRDGNFLYEKPSDNGQFGNWLPQNKIPPKLKITTIAAEDHRLYQHQGIDSLSIFRAIWSNIKYRRRVSGASTLAMQLVRCLRPAKRTYKNKIKEMYWAYSLQHHLGPDGVLREYLNRAPYGNRVQGAHRAALLYFDRPAADLSYAQAAFIAALPWAPSRLNPFRKKGRKRAIKRARRILRRARELQLFRKKDYEEAINDPILIQKKPKRSNISLHFTEFIRQNLKQSSKVKPQHQITTLRTTLDLKLQTIAIDALKLQLKILKSRGAGTGAVIVLDHRSGEILAYAGSHNYFDQKNKGAIDYIRTSKPPGSTLKPFIYALAIEQKQLTGASLFSDLATSFMWKRGAYHPRNYDSRYFGPLRMRVALGNSRNIPALHALSKVGVSKMLQRFRRLGLSTLQKSAGHYGLGLALGSGEVKLVELTRAYAVLARGGRSLQLKWIHQAKDSLGRIAKLHSKSSVNFAKALQGNQLFQTESAQVITKILSDPIARLPSFGRYGSLEFTYPVAGKTGTSQGFRDAWLLGFNDRVVMGCWIGNHDHRKMKKVSGGRGCGRIFQTVMKASLKRVDPLDPPTGFTAPKGWRSKKVCPLSGELLGVSCPGSVQEWFPPSHKHRYKTCPFHKKIRIDRRNNLRAGQNCPKEHTFSQAFISLPSLYGSWAQMMSFQSIPKSYSPFCPSKEKPTTQPIRLKITNPANKSRFLIDPTTPPEYSTLAFKVQSDPPVAEVVWFVNGKKVGAKAWPYKIRWQLEKGHHKIIAQTSDGKYRSRPIQIYIR